MHSRITNISDDTPNSSYMRRVAVLWLAGCLLCLGSHAIAQSPAIYPYLLDPTTYPDYTRRVAPTPDWTSFQNRPQFVSTRGWLGDLSDRWWPYQFTFTPTVSGTAALTLQNVDCDGTVLADNISCQQAPGPPDLLANSNFEGSNGWYFTGNSGFTTTTAHSGTRCASVASGCLVQASPGPAIQAGHTYLVTVWCKVTTGGQWVLIIGNLYVGGADVWESSPTVNNDWQQFQFFYTPSALSGNYNQFQVQSQPGGPQIYVDDFTVQEFMPSAPNLLPNPSFATANPTQGWTTTAGANLYPSGYGGGQSMLLRAGNSIQTTVNVVAGQPYTVTVWLSVLGRSQGSVQLSLGGAAMGSGTLSVANKTSYDSSGLVMWPNVGTLVGTLDSSTLSSWVNYGIYVHDPGGYGPASPWTGSYGQCLASATTLATLNSSLGKRFTGGDIGEQDARFANVFEACYEPFSLTNRFKDFRIANRYQGQCGDDLGNKMCLLSNLWLWHYPMKDGSVMMGGAQAQPKAGITNSQIQYSFLRGAGKQYGIPWYGNASIFSSDWLNSGTNYKSYPGTPYTGDSLGLMRRLMFTQYLYGSQILSFEGGQNGGDGSISPIGMVQEAMVQTVSQYGAPGPMHTPVGLLLDYWSGWMPGRWNRSVYTVWNGLGYGLGDYLSHDVFSMIYLHYEDCGFYQNEQGGLCNTPYGDVADTLLTDVSAPILQRYGVVVAAGDLTSADTELHDKIESYLAAGGNFVVTGQNAQRLWPEFGIGPGQVTISASASVLWSDSTTTVEPYSGTFYSVSALPAGSKVLATYSGSPVVVDIPRGSGTLTLLLSPYGLNGTALTGTFPSSYTYNVVLPKPYVLMGHVQKLLDNRLSGQRLFDVGNANIGYVTCRQGAGDYLVGLYNNNLSSQAFNINSHIGSIASITEWNLGSSVTNQPGFWPLGYENNNGGISDSSHIFGGDIRLFEVKVTESGTARVLGPCTPSARPLNRMVTVAALVNLKDTIQQWINFFGHFDGVKLDWTSLASAAVTFNNSGVQQVYEPISWLQRQQVRFVTDFSSGFLTGSLTLQTPLPGYAGSVTQFNGIMNKMATLGSGTLGRAADIVITAEEMASGQIPNFTAGVAALCTNAAARSITVHFKHRTTSWTPDIAHTLTFIGSVGATNLKFAANTADSPADISGLLGQAGSQLGLILIAPPASGSSAMNMSPVLSSSVIEILDASYSSWDSVYRDSQTAWSGTGAAAMVGTPITQPVEIYSFTNPANAAHYLSLPDTADLPGSLRQLTGFWNYFGGVKVDYKYLAYRDAQQCAQEGEWLANRNVRLIVDFSSDLNNYPGMTLEDSTTPGDGLSANYHRSTAIMNDVFEKMQAMGTTNCVIRPTTSTASVYGDIADRAWARGGITVHIQHFPANWMSSFQSPSNVAGIVDDAGAGNQNLKMAVNGCHDSNLSGNLTIAGGRLGMILLGYPNSPWQGLDVHGAARLGMSKSALSGRTQPLVLDSEYTDWNDTAADLSYLGWTSQTPLTMNSSVKQSTGTNLSGTGAGVWTGGGGSNGVPASTDVAAWTGSSLGAGLTLSSSASWNAISITGAASDISIGGSGQLTLGAGGIQQSGVNLSLACPIALCASQTWSVATTTLTVTGVISGSSAVTLEKAGSGTLILGNSNAFAGALVVTAGTLQLTAQNAAENSTIMMDGGSLVFDGSVSGGNFTIGGLSAVSSGSGYDITLQANAANPGPVTLTVGANGSSNIYNGALSGSGSLIKTGSGTLVLSGSSSFVGDVTVGSGTTGGGTLRVANSGALGTGPKTVWLTNPTNTNKWFELDGSASSVNLASNIAFVTSGNASPTGTLIRNVSGSNSIAGPISMDMSNGGTYISSEAGVLTLAGNITVRSTSSSNRSLTLGGSSTGANLFSGILSDSGSKIAFLIKADSGKWTITGSNTFSGGTVVNSGTLAVGATGKLGAGNLTVSSGAVCSLTNTAGAVADASSIYLTGSGRIDTAAGVVERVANLYVNGTAMAKGVWSAARDSVHFSGSGCILVVTPGLTAQQDWRQLFFGTTANAGNAADLANPDFDGFNNFLDYATGSSPVVPHGFLTSVALTGTSIDFYYPRSHAAVIDGFVFSVEWSDTLGNDWSTAGVTQSSGSDNGIVETVHAFVPLPSQKLRRFVHLKVSMP